MLSAAEKWSHMVHSIFSAIVLIPSINPSPFFFFVNDLVFKAAFRKSFVCSISIIPARSIPSANPRINGVFFFSILNFLMTV